MMIRRYIKKSFLLHYRLIFNQTKTELAAHIDEVNNFMGGEKIIDGNFTFEFGVGFKIGSFEWIVWQHLEFHYYETLECLATKRLLFTSEEEALDYWTQKVEEKKNYTFMTFIDGKVTYL